MSPAEVGPEVTLGGASAHLRARTAAVLDLGKSAAEACTLVFTGEKPERCYFPPI